MCFFLFECVVVSGFSSRCLGVGDGFSVRVYDCECECDCECVCVCVSVSVSVCVGVSVWERVSECVGARGCEGEWGGVGVSAGVRVRERERVRVCGRVRAGVCVGGCECAWVNKDGRCCVFV